MTDIITDAVRAGCRSLMSPGSTRPFPDCQCSGYGDVQIALETSARHAAEAMRERAAQWHDKQEARYRDASNQNLSVATAKLQWDAADNHARSAAAIRAIPIEGEPKS